MTLPIQAGQAYAGIGSRETPPVTLALMASVAARLDKLGLTLRSGGAAGADTYFELPVQQVPPEIFIPWANFIKNADGSPNRERNARAILVDTLPAWPEALALAEQHHPNWERCGPGARKLLARNGMQILGRDLKSPSAFVVCWTKNGGPAGGTGQALRLAMDRLVPIFNLQRPDHCTALEAALRQAEGAAVG